MSQRKSEQIHWLQWNGFTPADQLANNIQGLTTQKWGTVVEGKMKDMGTSVKLGHKDVGEHENNNTTERNTDGKWSYK